ncbi:hypothetical protein [Gordonibacter massiliensis (ex Traore et al. 2017)]|uniref:Uncharacterized protein n=1 Tax=Gordonibacter massiliensis (ex Traore et al. 2017) TaxID=1841863 RepID=A0A842JJL7_9ACTN|nr:hypothetical protein [Gordonibacter massiliensis (ex Traore et al. 2017)]MBC2890671.1 hypothetical protein [Gordonibacter massiliensis (ex Traore et al. 2017)]
MFRQKPQINTPLEAFDEFADVRMTLSGTSALALALAQSEISEPEAIRLISCLLDYCSLTVESACELICSEQR